MIDYALRFNTEADAITAATGTQLGRYDELNNWHWNVHFVLPNMQSWRVSQDNPDGTHNYLTGWMVLVSVLNRNVQLDNHPNLQFALLREGPPYVVINNIGAVLQDIGVQPIFAGSHYPIGGYGP